MATPLIAPLGLARSYIVSWILSELLVIAAVAISSKWLMDVYFADLRISEISDPPIFRYLFAFTFYPVLLAIKFTQMAPLVLLGITGYLRYEMRRRYVLAGLYLALTFVKPHLLILVYLAVLLRREWRVIASAAALFISFCAFAVFKDHVVFREYFDLITSVYPRIAPAGNFAGIRSLLQPLETYWI